LIYIEGLGAKVAKSGINCRTRVHRAQGELVGWMAHLELTQRDLVTLLLLTKDVVTNITIESKALNWEAVRSCIARKLGGGLTQL
jgi:hypothetical protein